MPSDTLKERAKRKPRTMPRNPRAIAIPQVRGTAKPRKRSGRKR